MLSNVHSVPSVATVGQPETPAVPMTPKDDTTPRRTDSTESLEGSTSTSVRNSSLKRREPYDKMNPPPIPHRRTQSLQSSFFQASQLSQVPTPTAPLIEPTAEMQVSRSYLLGNVCFTNFLEGPSNRFTTLMHETLECGYCRKQFGTLDTLKNHLIKAHHPVWICCHNLYRKKLLRDNHRRDYSCQEWPVPGTCGLEDFFISTKGEFTMSMKDGKCGYCEKETSSVQNLRRHLAEESDKFMGHEVWYAYGRFFKEAREMERFKEFCEMGNEDEVNWADADGNETGGIADRMDKTFAANTRASNTNNTHVHKRRRTISNANGVSLPSISLS